MGQDFLSYIEATDNPNDSIPQLSLHNVYMAISVSVDTDFDYDHEIQKLIEIFGNVLSPEYRMVPSEELQKNTNQLNIGLAEIIKHCYNVKNYKKPAIIFIAYCDYFDLDYNLVYQKLHHKIQLLIENDTKKMIGKDKFDKHKLKSNGGVIVTSLFDLTKNKK